MVVLNHFCTDHQMTSAQSSNSNFSETDFLLEDSVDADNHNSDSTATRLSLQIQLDENYLGQRIDQVAALVWSDFSREKLKQWMKEGHLLVNGNIVKPKYRCEGNELLTLNVELEAQTTSQAENIPLNIIYEDEDIIVINKEVGMVVHPGAGNPSGTLVNALLYHAPKLAELSRAGLVHRIDKDTSGLLVVAKNLEAQFSLSKQLAKKTVYRVYDLVTYGNIIAGGTIDEPALIEALNAGQVSFAGLDVFDNEPTPLAEILTHPKISLTPHIGASTNEAQERIGTELATLIIEHFKK